MAQSEVAICNIALARTGQREFITSLTGSSAPSKVCNVLYVEARQTVLASIWWPFATKRATLAELANTTRDGWIFVYALPVDCIAARSLWSGLRRPAVDQAIQFGLEHDAVSGKKVLLSDLEDAVLSYTADISAPGLFPPLFTDALAWKLAADIALAMPIKPQVGLAMQQGYQRALAIAAAAEFRQAQEDALPDSEFIRIRG